MRPGFSLPSWADSRTSRGLLHLVCFAKGSGSPPLASEFRNGAETKTGREEVIHQDLPRRNHVFSHVKQRAEGRLERARQNPLWSSSKLQNCRSQLCPAGGLDSVSSAEWDY